MCSPAPLVFWRFLLSLFSPSFSLSQQVSGLFQQRLGQDGQTLSRHVFIHAPHPARFCIFFFAKTSLPSSAQSLESHDKSWKHFLNSIPVNDIFNDYFYIFSRNGDPLPHLISLADPPKMHLHMLPASFRLSCCLTLMESDLIMNRLH